MPIKSAENLITRERAGGSGIKIQFGNESFMCWLKREYTPEGLEEKQMELF